MNKSDLIDRVSDTIGVGRRDAEAAVNTVIHGVMSEVKAGQKVVIAGFGAFNPTHRKARLGRNPRTGEPVKVAASKGVRFAPGTIFKNVVNGRTPLAAPAKTVAKPTTKKVAAKKAPAKRAPARKVAARKTAAKKSTAKRASARKTAAKRAPARKAPARKVAARRR
ncbi:MAG: HU family DNA-binding protein [Acidimicrobiales bacterium]|jgi:DNA-binding protein HU-beta